MSRLRRFTSSIAFYPVTAVYVAAAAASAAVAGRYLRLDLALVIVALVAVMAIQLSMRHEVRTVHHLVNSQRDELVARIDQLTAALVAAGLPVPDDRPGGRQ